MIFVQVSVGIGMYRRWKDTLLLACPHVGDHIDVDGISVECVVVIIGNYKVTVRDPKGCRSQESADELALAGWQG